MTTVTDANVHNVAVKGTFDDCQVMIRFGTQSADAECPALRQGCCKGPLR